MAGWVNRFANAGDTAMEVAENTALRVSYEFQNSLMVLC